MHDLEFEKAGQIVKVDPPAKLISTNMGLAMRAALDGAGIWATLDGYVHDAVTSGALVSLMEDWCEPFPGPFLYYPSRRQTPPALRAFIDFAADWRKRRTSGDS
jgi:DNA-binding transcriptional LysR family regulator